MEAKVRIRLRLLPSRRIPAIPLAWFSLKKQSYEASKLTPLAGHALTSDMQTTTRKMIRELSYCVRVDKRSLCLGDILLFCAIEEVRNRARHDSHRASTYIWPVLAGGFSNLPALHLYLAHGFKIIGFYEDTEPFMAVHNVSDKNTRRALKQVKGKLKSTFFLPVLKNGATSQPPVTWLAPNDVLAPSSTQGHSRQLKYRGFWAPGSRWSTEGFGV